MAAVLQPINRLSIAPDHRGQFLLGKSLCPTLLSYSFAQVVAPLSDRVGSGHPMTMSPARMEVSTRSGTFPVHLPRGCQGAGEGVSVGDDVGLGPVGEGVGVGVAVGLGVGVGDSVSVGLGVGLSVGVAVGVGVIIEGNGCGGGTSSPPGSSAQAAAKASPATAAIASQDHQRFLPFVGPVTPAAA